MSAVARWFVRPAGEAHAADGAGRARRAAREAPPALAIVAAGSAALPAAAAAALRHAGGGPVVLCCWRVAGAERARSAAALPSARRLAASLRARGLDAVAAGRLARAALPADDAQAVAALRRAEAACGDAPCVPVVGGPRGEAWDAVLAERDLVLVHGDDPAVVRVAVERLASERCAAAPLGSVPPRPLRALAVAGLMLPGPGRRSPRAAGGQAAVLLVGILCAVLLGAAVLGLLAAGVGAQGRQQRSADLGALAAARRMHDLHPRLFEPALIDGVPNPRRLERAAYLAAAREAGEAVARANGAEAVAVTFPDADPVAPGLVRVAVGERVAVTVAGARERIDVRASADAQIVPVAAALGAAWGDEYRGPLAVRQGQRMRPDVAQAFDRMAAAAAADGVQLVIASAFRANAEQAALFAAHPDPKWVAPPGTSLHRLGTELDLGPASAYPWLAANAPRFHFVMRYDWEPWHWGYALNAGSSAAMARRRGGDGALPAFVPEIYAPAIARAAQRWNVSATLLAAQLQKESGFDPSAVSAAGARGIAQFMPGTAAAYGLSNPHDPDAAIDAQAHLMRDLLRRFGSVPLALAAYNAGPARVAACGCVPPIPETTAYVAAILGLMGGAGDPAGLGGLEIRLVR